MNKSVVTPVLWRGVGAEAQFSWRNHCCCSLIIHRGSLTFFMCTECPLIKLINSNMTTSCMRSWSFFLRLFSSLSVIEGQVIACNLELVNLRHVIKRWKSSPGNCPMGKKGITQSPPEEVLYIFHCNMCHLQGHISSCSFAKIDWDIWISLFKTLFCMGSLIQKKRKKKVRLLHSQLQLVYIPGLVPHCHAPCVAIYSCAKWVMPWFANIFTHFTKV